MKAIKLVYPDLQNAGDLLNVDLVERLSGAKVERSKVYNADMLAIGGALFGAQYSIDFKRKIAQGILSVVYGNKPLYVWGSGFLFGDNPNGLYRKNLKVCALRGAKTQQKLKELTGTFYDVPLADGGLLAEMMLDGKVEKKYEIGLVPHLSQQGEAAFQKMAAQDNVRLIDIKKSPKEAIHDIAECEYIVSSSLHGLIFADALHIPSLHVLGEKHLAGGTFKFEDYYSSFGIEDKPWILSERQPTAKDIIDEYRIDGSAVEEKKKALVECFPKF